MQLSWHKCEHKTLHFWGDFLLQHALLSAECLCAQDSFSIYIDHYHVACLVPGAEESGDYNMLPTSQSRRETDNFHLLVSQYFYYFKI